MDVMDVWGWLGGWGWDGWKEGWGGWEVGGVREWVDGSTGELAVGWIGAGGWIGVGGWI